MISDHQSSDTLFVEGNDDRHAIMNLLGRHYIDSRNLPRPFQIKALGDVDTVLQSMTTHVVNAVHGPVGFVVDADDSITKRWGSIRNRFGRLSYSLPETCPPEGFCSLFRSPGEETERSFPFGIWIMPDCQTETGMLEDFLATLVPAEQQDVWNLADSATGEAKQLGAPFIDSHRSKAHLHCWLAWQNEPGKPYGQALTARILADESPSCRRFLTWLQKLFGFQVPPPPS